MYGAPFINDTAVESTAATEQPAAQAPTAEAPADQAQQQQQASNAEVQAEEAPDAAPEAPPAIEIPANIAEMRDQDGPRRLYSPQNTYADPIPDALFDHVVEIAEPVRAAVVNELREISADLGLSVSDVANIRTRAAYLHKNPQDAGEQQKEARHVLKAAFGDADRALQDARALAARDPRVRNLIHTMGLGNDPETLVMLTYAARRQRNAGRL
ncbi:MAG: hypothetical protein AB1544_11435 [Pseudomonadota bacterium]|jgi:hypothetical protein